MSSQEGSSEGSTAAAEGGRLRGSHPAEAILYDRLIDAIIDKHLRPGEHLNEVKLATAYDVPRSRVRRVLERLRDESVVRFELHRGAFVSRPTVAEARHVYEARREIEAVAVRLACAHATKSDIAALNAHLADETEAFRTNHAVNRVAMQFHFLIARISANPVLERILGTLIRRTVLIQSVYERKTGVLCLTHEHVTIAGHIAAGRADAAAAEFVAHFDHVRQSLDLSEERWLEKDIYGGADPLG